MRKENIVPIIGMAQVDNLVCSIKGGTMVSAEYVSDFASMNKKMKGGKSNAFYNRLQCVTFAISLQAGVDYEKTISSRSGEDFESNPLPWGSWYCVNRIIENKGKHYFRLYETKNTKFYRWYFLDGQLVTNADLIKSIESSFYEKKGSKRQEAVGLTFDKQVKPFNIEFGNLRKFKANGNTFEVISL